MAHGRRLPIPEELLQSDVAKRAGLTLVEVIVIVLYTGPMVGRALPTINFFKHSVVCSRRADSAY
jgi:hypothetical protein